MNDPPNRIDRPERVRVVNVERFPSVAPRIDCLFDRPSYGRRWRVVVGGGGRWRAVGASLWFSPPFSVASAPFCSNSQQINLGLFYP